jgi:hypothetical protein
MPYFRRPALPGLYIAASTIIAAFVVIRFPGSMGIVLGSALIALAVLVTFLKRFWVGFERFRADQDWAAGHPSSALPEKRRSRAAGC